MFVRKIRRNNKPDYGMYTYNLKNVNLQVPEWLKNTNNAFRKVEEPLEQGEIDINSEFNIDSNINETPGSDSKSVKINNANTPKIDCQQNLEIDKMIESINYPSMNEHSRELNKILKDYERSYESKFTNAAHTSTKGLKRLEGRIRNNNSFLGKNYEDQEGLNYIGKKRKGFHYSSSEDTDSNLKGNIKGNMNNNSYYKSGGGSNITSSNTMKNINPINNNFNSNSSNSNFVNNFNYKQQIPQVHNNPVNINNINNINIPFNLQGTFPPNLVPNLSPFNQRLFNQANNNNSPFSNNQDNMDLLAGYAESLRDKYKIIEIDNLSNPQHINSDASKIKSNRDRSESSNKIHYDGLLESLSDDECKENQQTSNNNYNQEFSNTIYFPNTNSVNNSESNAENNFKCPSNVVSDNSYKKGEISSIKSCETNTNTSKEKKDSELGEIVDNLNRYDIKRSTDLAGEPIMSSNNTSTSEKFIGDKLSNLISSRKTKIYFKLFYKEKELKVELNILNKKMNKSVLKIDFFLDMKEFSELNIGVNFELSAKLEMTNMGRNEETQLFFDRLSSDLVAFVEDERDFFAIVYSRNKEAVKLIDFKYITTSFDIHSKNDLVLILKITEEKAKEKIRSILKDMFENENRTNICGMENLRESSIRSTGRRVNDLRPDEEVTIKESALRDIMKEVEELRQFKYTQKDVIEELIKKKEIEIKHKFKAYYEKLIENGKDQLEKVLKEKDTLTLTTEKFSNAQQTHMRKIDKLEKEITRLNFELSYYREKNESLLNDVKQEKEKSQDLERKVKDIEKKKLNSEINYEKKLAEMEKKLKESGKDSAKIAPGSGGKVVQFGPSTVKVDDFIIQEVPINTPHEEFNPHLYNNKLLPYNDNFACIICLNKTRDCLFVECNHLVCCWECLKDKIIIKKKKKKSTKRENDIEMSGNFCCPICKIENFNFRKIFIS